MSRPFHTRATANKDTIHIKSHPDVNKNVNNMQSYNMFTCLGLTREGSHPNNIKWLYYLALASLYVSYSSGVKCQETRGGDWSAQ